MAKQQSKQSQAPQSEAEPSYLSGLTAEQRAAVTAPIDRPALVLAGAGAGKTHTLVRRIAYLQQEAQLAPQEIMLATFTNAAADEIAGRAKGFIGNDAKRMRSGTIHSFCVHLLKEEGHRVEIIPDTAKKDPATGKWSESQGILMAKVCQDVQQRYGITPRDQHFQGPNFWMPWVDFVELEQVDDDRPRSNHDRHMDAQQRILARMEASRPYSPSVEQLSKIAADVWYQYEDQKGVRYDFTDMLTGAARALRDPETIERWRSKIRYALVDEFQDTDTLQLRIIRTLINDTGLFAVGDDSQAVYRFRRGDPEATIYNWAQAFPNGQVYTVTQNFRSTPQIIDVSNKIITANHLTESRAPYLKQLRPREDDFTNAIVPRVTGYETDVEEAEDIAREIQKEVRENRRSFRDYYVLYRVNAQSEPIERAMVERGIPVIVKGGSFFNRKRVADCIAYIDLAINTDDDVAFLRVYDVASELHPTPTRYLGRAFVEDCRAEKQRSLYAGMLKAYPKLWRTKQGGVDDFKAYVNKLQMLILDEADPQALLNTVVETYRDYLQRRDGVNQDEETEDLDQLIETAGRFHSWEDFSAYVQIMREAVEQADKGDRDAVSLLTAHGSKGLERPVVYVVGMSEGVLPHWMATGDPITMLRRSKIAETPTIDIERNMMPPAVFDSTVEDERCIAFVLASRAREVLRMSYCRQIGRRIWLSPSRFLYEAELLERPALPEASEAWDAGDEAGEADEADDQALAPPAAPAFQPDAVDLWDRYAQQQLKQRQI